jgi:hypothetical protein
MTRLKIFILLFYQGSMIIYLGVIYKYNCIFIIVFDGRRDRSVERKGVSPG